MNLTSNCGKARRSSFGLKVFWEAEARSRLVRRMAGRAKKCFMISGKAVV